MRPPPAHRPIARPRLVLALTVAVALATLASSAVAQLPAIQYVYDDLNRLRAVVDQAGTASLYSYDGVGNVLRIERFTGVTADPPQVTAITPAEGEAGTTVAVGIAGRNLLVTRRVGVDNPGVGVRFAGATPDAIAATFVIGLDAPLGPATVTVTTSRGAATTTFTVVRPRPVVTRITPAAAPVGLGVTIEGRQLVAADGPTVVTFAGAGGARVTAPLTEPATATRLAVDVPAGAVSGDVVVTVGGVASAGVPFTVQAPLVTRVSPANAATAVAVTTQVTVVVSSAIDPATVTPATFTLSAGGVRVPALVYAGATAATLVPAVRLDDAREYTIDVTAGVTAPGGTPITAFQSRFTTETVIPGPVRLDGIVATATSGTPADPARASANTGQAVSVRGAGFDTGGVQLETIALASGVVQAAGALAPLAGIAADGTAASATIPATAGTGLARLRRAGLPSAEAALLQVVPRLTTVGPAPGGGFAPGQTITLGGSGFTADMTVRFPRAGGGAIAQPVVAGSVNLPGSQAQVVVPAEVGGGDVVVVTPGGASAPLRWPALVRLEKIDGSLATAASGTPADLSLPSTNGDEYVFLRGAALTADMALRTERARSGTLLGTFDRRLEFVAADGATARAFVFKSGPLGGSGAITGPVRVVDPATGAQSARTLVLQIVPTLTNVVALTPGAAAPGVTLVLSGSGFTADMTARFPLAAGGVADQPIGLGTVDANGTQARVVVPAGVGAGLHAVSVTTPGGGTSAPRVVPFPALARLENADGSLARAPVGTPADPALPSANGDAYVFLRGAGMAPGAVFRSPRSRGGVFLGTVDRLLEGVAADGTRAQAFLFKTGTLGGSGIITGTVRLVDPTTGLESPVTPLLQIVPTLASVATPASGFAAGQTLTLRGSGFTADMVVRFRDATGTHVVAQPIVGGSVDMNGATAQVVVPADAPRFAMTVLTAGGESNAIAP